jgi:hypothetical protein
MLGNNGVFTDRYGLRQVRSERKATHRFVRLAGESGAAREWQTPQQWWH